MITTRLALTVALNLFAVIVSLLVARHLLRRPLAGDPRTATRAFALWWIGFAGNTGANTLSWLAAAYGMATPAVIAPLTYVSGTAIAVMIGGLLYYLAYVFTGRTRWLRAVVGFYSASWIALVALVAYLQPIGIRLTQHAGEVTYAIQPPPAAALWLGVFFLLPPLVGAIAYGTLALRVKDAAHRYRILAVSIGIFAWFATSLILTGAGAKGDVASSIAKTVGMSCLLLILSAYVQPAWLSAWLPQDLARLDPAARVPATGPQARARRREALMQRVRELV